MKKNAVILASVFFALLLVIPIASATTSTIETTELTFTYLEDQPRFRYWYNGDALKYDLHLKKVIEKDDEGKIVQQIELKDDSVEIFRLTKEDANTLLYKFDNRPDDGPLVYIKLHVEMNYFEVTIGLVGFNHLTHTVAIEEVTNEGSIERRLTADWTYYNVIVESTEELTSIYIPLANLGITVGMLAVMIISVLVGLIIGFSKK